MNRPIELVRPGTALPGDARRQVTDIPFRMVIAPFIVGTRHRHLDDPADNDRAVWRSGEGPDEVRAWVDEVKSLIKRLVRRG
jgi:hypothetical protein